MLNKPVTVVTEEDKDIDDAASQDSQFVEKYVEQQMKENVYPLRTELEEKK